MRSSEDERYGWIEELVLSDRRWSDWLGLLVTSAKQRLHRTMRAAHLVSHTQELEEDKILSTLGKKSVGHPSAALCCLQDWMGT